MSHDQVPIITWVKFKEAFRKRAYDRRREAMTDGEQSAPRRASQFFGGLDGWNEQRRRIDSF